MREPKFDVGDVVRIVGLIDGVYEDILGRVESVDCLENGSQYSVEFVRSGRLVESMFFYENELEGVTIEEVREHFANKPRRGFIVDGLTVDELESGQDEAYQTFRTAANEANREEEQRAAEEDRKEGKILAELNATVILWAVLTIVSLVMWVIVMERTGEMLFTLIGLASAEVGFFLMAKPIGALIAVCFERCKALRERRKRGHGGEDPHNMG